MSRALRLPTTLNIVALLLLSAATAGASQVDIDSGPIAGEVVDADTGLRVYRGIPFAAAPTGDLRWRAPQPVAPWQEVRDATEFGPICPQPPMLAALTGEQLPASSEDCLFLNVWTTAESSDERLPVMVWIHGGGLNLGWSNQGVYDGSAFASRGVVLVSVNYRLGPLGFLSLPQLSKESEHGVSGNYGFLDQVAALEWVQRNIAAFGGDADSVTIFGESAGGTSVHALLTASGTDGLFHRAIAQSPWITETNIAHLRESSPFVGSAEEIGEGWVASLVGDGGKTSLEALRAIPAAEMIAKAGATFQPVIAVDGRFMPEHGERAFAGGRSHRVPLMAGSNADEGTMFMAAMAGSPDRYRDGVAQIYGGQAEAVLALYPVPEDGKVAGTVNRFMTDSWFLRATRAMLLGTAATGTPSYQYHFTRRSRAMPAWGAHHAAELSFVFNTPGGMGEPEWDEVESRLAEAMIRYWVQFAKTGDPNTEGLPEWPLFDAESESYMELGDRIEAGQELCASRCTKLEGILSTVWAESQQTGGR
jgi:para-nitrobenzyl esterase